ncbi:MAG: alanine--glyoxylate aminotransferase family protein [Vulcanimicrobiota bacterium]
MSFHFDPPERILLGPGPSNVPARVLTAMARPTVGHLDSTYLALMEEVQRLLRLVFKTENEATFAVTGGGTAAMECALYNLVEPGNTVVCCVHGYFGDRMRQMLERAGADLHLVTAPWGQPIDPTDLKATLAKLGRADLVTVVHGETSTGVRQDILPLAELARQYQALILVDTVASLGGVEFETDAWGVDCAYTGAQKCLSAPPGISPITFGPQAMARIERRNKPCSSWYLDVMLNLSYWRRPAAYHHTGPINLTYALYEALKLIEEEGLPRRVAHIQKVAEQLWAGLDELGLPLVVAKEHRLPTLTTVLAPVGVDEASVRHQLMHDYGIEIAGGLGDFKGRAWRVGLMGHSAQSRYVDLLLTGLSKILSPQLTKL